MAVYSDNLCGCSKAIAEDKKGNLTIVDKAENILRKIFGMETYFKKIRDCFVSIYGSPASKEEIISNLLNKYKYSNSEVLMVGDA